MKTYRSLTTGLYVGRQADQLEDQEYEIIEVPTDKQGLLDFINELAQPQVIPSPEASAPDRPSSSRPQPSEEEQTYARFRADVAAGRVDLDETLLAAPLDTCLRLAGLIYERTREHVNKIG